MIGRCVLASVALASFTLACGPAPEPVAPNAAAAPTTSPPSSTAPASDPGAGARASNVRFDDLGIAFAVPPGYRVLGDEELASRIRASADLRLNRSLRERAKEKKGLPLLTLEKPTSEANDFLTVSVSVVLVPKDAKATELTTHEQGVMAEHLAGFQVVEGPKAKSIGPVEGAELVSRYQVKRAGEAHRAASALRVFVRDGVATIAVAVWPETSSARGEEARLVLDGLSFYEPGAQSAPAP
ncbi:MAG: hypothetical protein U0235_19185 [Polyangiaceae bacterium]